MFGQRKATGVDGRGRLVEATEAELCLAFGVGLEVQRPALDAQYKRRVTGRQWLRQMNHDVKVARARGVMFHGEAERFAVECVETEQARLVTAARLIEIGERVEALIREANG